MKKLYFILLLLPLASMAQIKATNPISVQNLNAGLVLDNNTQTVTLTLIGPSDRWMAIQYGQFSGGMEAGADVAYYNGTTLVDARHNGIGVAPSADAENNWTVIENTVSAGFRTLKATRPFDSPDATDYDFNFADNTIGIALARGNSASFSLAYHGAANRLVNTALGFTNLGTPAYTQEQLAVYPNPSKGQFTIQSPEIITEVSLYNLAGSKLRTLKPEPSEKQLHLQDLSAGVYLIEIKSAAQTSWRKLMVE